MRRWIERALTAILLLVPLSPAAFALELETKHTTVVYDDARQLGAFTSSVRMGGLGYLLWGKKSVTAPDEARNKVDAVVEKVMTILEMVPAEFHFKITLLATREDVQAVYKQKFSRLSDFIAFYAPQEQTIYVSVDDVNLAVFSHEVAHAVIDHYFEVSPPSKIHELLAQYVEAQIAQ